MRIKGLFAVILPWCLILSAGCADGSRQETATWVLEEENAITFSDGERADLWRPDRAGAGDARYQLSDGTALLTIQAPSGPDNVYGSGGESLDDLSEPAQKAIKAFYDKQGLLYDAQTELQRAYAAYQSCKDSGMPYHERFISQSVSPTASNSTILCFLTSVILPVDGQTAQEIRLGAAFDRESGEALRNWDLFTLPEKETGQWLIHALNVHNPALQAEMETALKPEYIVLFPERLEVTFPQGTLPGQEHCYVADLSYDKLKTVLQAWAVPVKGGS